LDESFLQEKPCKMRRELSGALHRRRIEQSRAGRSIVIFAAASDVKTWRYRAAKRTRNSARGAPQNDAPKNARRGKKQIENGALRTALLQAELRPV
jgi:hypothetical protein